MPNELLQYQEQLADIQEKMEAIHKTADAEQDGILTEEQQAEWDALSAKREQVKATEARAIELREERRNAPAARSSGPVVTEIHNRVESDPRYGFQTHRDFALSVIGAAGVGAVEHVADERLRPLAAGDGGMPDDGGLAFMLPRAFTPHALLLDAGGKYDADGKFHAAAGSDEHGAYDYGRGGAFMQTTLLPGTLALGFEGDPTAGRTQMVPMATPSVKMIARVDKNHTSSVSGGFTVTRRPETADISASRTEYETVRLDASGLFGLAYATNELLSFSPISFAAVIEAGFRDQFAHKVLHEKIRGLGGVSGEYLGILTALASASLGPTVAVTRTTSSTLKALDAVNMRARCWGYNRAIWLANHDCYPAVSAFARILEDEGATPVGAGAISLYQDSLQDDRPDRLLGRPIFYSEYPSTVGSAGDLILVNCAEFLEGIYQPMQGAESVHVRFVQHETAFKFWLLNAGAPWWRSAMTPEQSSTTLSPMVIVAA
jgi:HK97 family phage major capsid protein